MNGAEYAGVGPPDAGCTVDSYPASVAWAALLAALLDPSAVWTEADDGEVGEASPVTEQFHNLVADWV